MPGAMTIGEADGKGLGISRDEALQALLQMIADTTGGEAALLLRNTPAGIVQVSQCGIQPHDILAILSDVSISHAFNSPGSSFAAVLGDTHSISVAVHSLNGAVLHCLVVIGRSIVSQASADMAGHARLIGHVLSLEMQTSLHAKRITELEVQVARRGQFIASVSHEFRTPLNAIIGFSDLILSGVACNADRDRYEGYIRDIRNSGDHLLSLVNDVLDFSRIEAGGYRPHHEPCNLFELIGAAAKFVQHRAAASGVHLVLPDCQSGIVASIDRRAILQVLMNLMSNAVKFSGTGSEVSVSCAVNDAGNAEISVIDQGPGMTPGEVEIAMTPYGQNHRSGRSTEGTGLGLPIANGLMQAHGGVLAVESEPGVGTVVTITLPAHCLAGNDSEVVPVGI